MSNQDQRVIIRSPSGAHYVVTDAAAARRVHPDAAIVSYADGRAYAAQPDADTDADTDETDAAPAPEAKPAKTRKGKG